MGAGALYPQTSLQHLCHLLLFVANRRMVSNELWLLLWPLVTSTGHMGGGECLCVIAHLGDHSPICYYHLGRVRCALPDNSQGSGTLPISISSPRMGLCAGCRLVSKAPATPLSQTCGSPVTISPISHALDSFWKIQVSSVLLPKVSW